MTSLGPVERSIDGFDQAGLHHLTFRSPALGRRGDVTVFIPRQSSTAEPLPLVLLLHGVHGSHWSWSRIGGVHLTAQRLIDAGRIRPIAIAMPSDGLFGDGSGYFAHGGADYEEWILGDVPRFVYASHEEVSRDTPLFIAGPSMGGFGALRLGAKHPARFDGISAHSAFSRAEQLLAFVDAADRYGDLADPELTVSHWMKRNRSALPPIRFDCGTGDDLASVNLELHQALVDAAIEHRYELHPGGHDWTYWRRRVEDSLCFFEGVRDRPRRRPLPAGLGA